MASPKPPDSCRRALLASRIQWVSIAVTVVAFVIAVRGLPVARALPMAVEWVEGLGPLAPAAFAAIYFLATMLMAPAWPLSVAAGALFGLFLGSAVVITGATAGAIGAFVLTRYLARGAVERKLSGYPRFAAIDRAVGEGGWKIVLLLRLSPVFPFTLQNYLYGLTAIRFWPCVLATAVGIVPGVFMYVYFGVAGRTGIEAATGVGNDGWGQTFLLGIGLIATVVVTAYITHLARNALRQQDGLAPPAERPPASTASNPGRSAAIAACLAVTMVIIAAWVHLSPAIEHPESHVTAPNEESRP